MKIHPYYCSQLLQSMSRFFKFLPGKRRQALLHEVTGKTEEMRRAGRAETLL